MDNVCSSRIVFDYVTKTNLKVFFMWWTER